MIARDRFDMMRDGVRLRDFTPTEIKREREHIMGHALRKNHRTTRGQDAEDIAQEAFASILQSTSGRPLWDTGTAALAGERALYGVRTEVHPKTGKRGTRVNDDVEQAFADIPSLSGATWPESEWIDAIDLKRLITREPFTFMKAFVRHEIHGEDLARIASDLGVSLKTMGNWISEARVWLRDSFRRERGDDLPDPQGKRKA